MGTEREYVIDYNDPKQAATATLQMHIDTLVSCRKHTDDPEELEWEIRLYQFMLEDPETRLNQYNEIRWSDRVNFISLDKRDIAKRLGWEVR